MDVTYRSLSPNLIPQESTPVDFHLKTWYQVGIYHIKEIMNGNGKLLTFTQNTNKHNQYSLQSFDYYKVNSAVTKYINKYKRNDKYEIHNPSIPLYLKILFQHKKGTQDF